MKGDSTHPYARVTHCVNFSAKERGRECSRLYSLTRSSRRFTGECKEE